MSSLKPVPRSYCPDYPRFLTEADIREILRPSLLARFSRETLLAGAMLTGLTAGGCSRGASDPAPAAGGQGATGGSQQVQRTDAEDPPLKALGNNTTRGSADLRQRVDRLVGEILGSNKRGYWNELTSLRTDTTLSSNPAVKSPMIPISFGNSYVGVFDTEAARDATRRLFTAYGIELKENVPIRQGGYEFVADGFDLERGIGFELTMPDVAQPGQEPTAQDASSRLDTEEMQALDKDLTAGKIRMFVAQAENYPNMDGDLYTPMEYYLSSVIDYLNWVHGDQVVDTTQVLGLEPGLAYAGNWRKLHPELPGFEGYLDPMPTLKVDGGQIDMADEWAGFGQSSVKVTLNPQGKLVYTPPADAPVFLAQETQFACHLYVPGEAAAATFLIEVTGTNDKTWSIRQKVESRWLRPKVHAKTGNLPFDQLKSISFSVESDQPVSFYLDDVSLSRDPTGAPVKE